MTAPDRFRQPCKASICTTLRSPVRLAQGLLHVAAADHLDSLVFWPAPPPKVPASLLRAWATHPLTPTPPTLASIPPLATPTPPSAVVAQIPPTLPTGFTAPCVTRKDPSSCPIWRPSLSLLRPLPPLPSPRTQATGGPARLPRSPSLLLPTPLRRHSGRRTTSPRLRVLTA